MEVPLVLMSSKNFNKKSDNKNDKAEKEALKEAEIVAELAPNDFFFKDFTISDIANKKHVNTSG